jgi:glycine/D-amino acid oxidase-like deaminating enzyme
MLGVELNVIGKVIQVTAVEAPHPIIDQLIGGLEGGLTLKQTRYGTLLIGGGWPGLIGAGGRFDVDRQSVAGNLGIAQRILPAIAGLRVLRSWPGAIAQCYDDDGQLLQIAGQLPGVPGAYVISGGMLFTLGPLYAKLVVEQMTTGKPSMPLHIHDPARFVRRGARTPTAAVSTL